MTPPAAKRQRTEAVANDSNAPEASPSKRANGATEAPNTTGPMTFSSAPSVTSATAEGAPGTAVTATDGPDSDRAAQVDDEDEEEEEQAVPEEEDHSRRDMYLDTVS